MFRWKYNMMDLPNIKCASKPLNHRSKASYSAPQDKEAIIKPYKIEYTSVDK